jgi:hypothetical protein
MFDQSWIHAGLSRCWNKHADEGLNEEEMRDLHLEKDVPISVEEE